jgi:hypothetical protein
MTLLHGFLGSVAAYAGLHAAQYIGSKLPVICQWFKKTLLFRKVKNKMPEHGSSRLSSIY